FMQQIKGGVDDNQKQLNMIYQEIVSIQTHMQQSEKKPSESMKINSPQIDPNQLQNPEITLEETKRKYSLFSGHFSGHYSVIGQFDFDLASVKEFGIMNKEISSDSNGT
ncbi:1835_t:CDS:2, partial [Scutellospora calospora]